MPKLVEMALKRQAEKLSRLGKLKKKRGESEEKAENRFTYGVLRHKFGWKPSRENK